MIKLEKVDVFSRDCMKSMFSIVEQTDVGLQRIGGVSFDGKEYHIDFNPNYVVSFTHLQELVTEINSYV